MRFRRKTPLQIWLEEAQRREELEAQQEQEDRELAAGIVRAVLGKVAGFVKRPAFRFVDAPGTQNASAPMCSLGVLSFDLLWMCRVVYRYYGLWAVVALVLHEAAHTLDCRRVHDDWNVEHYADRGAGWLSGMLGYDLAGVRAFYLNELRGGWTGSTHPPAQSRILKFELGFSAGVAEREQQERAAALRNWAKQWRSSLPAGYSWR